MTETFEKVLEHDLKTKNLKIEEIVAPPTPPMEAYGAEIVVIYHIYDLYYLIIVEKIRFWLMQGQNTVIFSYFLWNVVRGEILKKFGALAAVGFKK